jgi:hypothetical protein
MRLQSNRPGFALPLALLVIGFLTIGITTALVNTDTEARTTSDREAQADAFGLAQAGLERFAVSRFVLGFRDLPPAVVESTRLTLPGGYADVISRLVRPKTTTEPALYVIKSRGVNVPGGSLAWMLPAVHTVGQYAFFREGKMQVIAGWTSLSGLQKNGGSGEISGYDNCGVEPPVAGAAVPDGMYDQTGGNLVPTGNPDTLYMGTQDEMADKIKVDWDGIVNQNAIVPDVVIPADPWPSFTDPDYWPVIRIEDLNYSLPSTGRGTIIALGDLTIAGSDHWDGILLVGRNLTADGNNTVEGATVTGLNVKLGESVPVNDVGNGTKTYVYDSCNVLKAANRFGAMWLIPNTWMGNWASW